MRNKPTKKRYETFDNLFVAINDSDFMESLEDGEVVEIKVMSNEKQLSLFVEKK